MYAWEKPFEKIVSKIRALEISVIGKASQLRGLFISIMVFSDRTILFLAVVSFVLMGNNLTADVTLPLVTYFNILQLITAIYFPQALLLGSEAFVSIKRMEVRKVTFILFYLFQFS